MLGLLEKRAMLLVNLIEVSKHFGCSKPNFQSSKTQFLSMLQVEIKYTCVFSCNKTNALDWLIVSKRVTA